MKKRNLTTNTDNEKDKVSEESQSLGFLECVTNRVLLQISYKRYNSRELDNYFGYITRPFLYLRPLSVTSLETGGS